MGRYQWLETLFFLCSIGVKMSDIQYNLLNIPNSLDLSVQKVFDKWYIYSSATRPWVFNGKYLRKAGLKAPVRPLWLRGAYDNCLSLQGDMALDTDTFNSSVVLEIPGLYVPGENMNQADFFMSPRRVSYGYEINSTNLSETPLIEWTHNLGELGTKYTHFAFALKSNNRIPDSTLVFKFLKDDKIKGSALVKHSARGEPADVGYGCTEHSEIIDYGNGAQTSFPFDVKAIVPKSLYAQSVVNVDSNDVVVTGTDDGVGGIESIIQATGCSVTGTITNYSSGEGTIIFGTAPKTDEPVRLFYNENTDYIPPGVDVDTGWQEESLGTGDGVETTFSGTLGKKPVTKILVSIKTYILDGEDEKFIQIIDDGRGILTGYPFSDMALGSIDYTTGEWEINFKYPVVDGKNIQCSYKAPTGNKYDNGDSGTNEDDDWNQPGIMDIPPNQWFYTELKIKWEDEKDTVVDRIQLNALKPIQCCVWVDDFWYKNHTKGKLTGTYSVKHTWKKTNCPPSNTSPPSGPITVRDGALTMAVVRFEDEVEQVFEIMVYVAPLNKIYNLYFEGPIISIPPKFDDIEEEVLSTKILAYDYYGIPPACGLSLYHNETILLANTKDRNPPPEGVYLRTHKGNNIVASVEAFFAEGDIGKVIEVKDHKEFYNIVNYIDEYRVQVYPAWQGNTGNSYVFKIRGNKSCIYWTVKLSTGMVYPECVYEYNMLKLSLSEGDEITAMYLLGEYPGVSSLNTTLILHGGEGIDDGSSPRTYSPRFISNSIGCVASKTPAQDEFGNVFLLTSNYQIAYITPDGIRTVGDDEGISEWFKTITTNRLQKARGYYSNISGYYKIIIPPADASSESDCLILDIKNSTLRDGKSNNFIVLSGNSMVIEKIIVNDTNSSIEVGGDDCGFLNKINLSDVYQYGKIDGLTTIEGSVIASDSTSVTLDTNINDLPFDESLMGLFIWVFDQNNIANTLQWRRIRKVGLVSLSTIVHIQNAWSINPTTAYSWMLCPIPIEYDVLYSLYPDFGGVDSYKIISYYSSLPKLWWEIYSSGTDMNMDNPSVATDDITIEKLNDDRRSFPENFGRMINLRIKGLCLQSGIDISTIQIKEYTA